MAKGTLTVIVERRRVGELIGVAVRQSKPSVLKRNQIAVRLTLEIPDEAFAPLEPVAVISIPLERTRPPAVEVTGLAKPADQMLEAEATTP